MGKVVEFRNLMNTLPGEGKPSPFYPGTMGAFCVDNRWVLCHGCFDILHVGHIRHLQAASKLGPVAVTITTDRFANKGIGRPIFPADLRAESIAALSCVEIVAINLWESA